MNVFLESFLNSPLRELTKIIINMYHKNLDWVQIW